MVLIATYMPGGLPCCQCCGADCQRINYLFQMFAADAGKPKGSHRMQCLVIIIKLRCFAGLLHTGMTGDSQRMSLCDVVNITAANQLIGWVVQAAEEQGGQWGLLFAAAGDVLQKLSRLFRAPPAATLTARVRQCCTLCHIAWRVVTESGESRR